MQINHPLSDIVKYIETPTSIIIITIVIASATSVIPFLFFPILFTFITILILFLKIHPFYLPKNIYLKGFFKGALI